MTNIKPLSSFGRKKEDKEGEKETNNGVWYSYKENPTIGVRKHCRIGENVHSASGLFSPS